MIKPEVVVIVNDTPNHNGGAAKVAIDSAIGLANQNIKVIYFSAQPLEKEWEYTNIELINLNQYDILSNPNRIEAITQGIYNRKAKIKFRQLLDKLDPKTTVIHFHGWTKALSSSLFYETSRKKYKLVITLHEYFSFCPNGGMYNYVNNRICKLHPMSLSCITCNCDSRSYGHKLWRVCRQVVHNLGINRNKNVTYLSISELNKKVATKYLNENSKILSLKNPIDFNTEVSNAVDTNIDNRIFYLFIGRISPEKGINLFCEAMTSLEKKAIVIGDGENLSYYKEKYKNINFVGWKTKKEISTYLHRSRALIFPSFWYEGSPLTTKEVQSYGIPLIVSDGCAAKEDVIEGITGFTFELGNLSSLKEKIKLLETKDWNKLSQGALDRFNEYDHTLQKHTKDLLQIYSNILTQL